MLRGTESHPSAEAIYAALKSEIPELSLGTVYRNLRLLEQDGLIRSVCSVDGQTRYDAMVEPHVHCICRRCRRVIDARSINKEEIFSVLLLENGFLPEGFELTVNGLCAECREK